MLLPPVRSVEAHHPTLRHFPRFHLGHSAANLTAGSTRDMRKGSVSAQLGRKIARLSTSSRSCPGRQYHSLPFVSRIDESFDGVDLNEFRQTALIPEKPVFMTTSKGGSSTKKNISIPAATKWFSPTTKDENSSPSTSASNLLLAQEYLAPFSDTILPYELTITHCAFQEYINSLKQQQTTASLILTQYLEPLFDPSDRDRTFYIFNAPLRLFLHANNPTCPPLPQLYIAQAQIADLPPQLRDDLPTPKIVREAGKGDVYDANIWMGTPPTYTPLHRDPNPNLFVQLAGEKRVRIFAPNVGQAIYRNVQQKIGAGGSGRIRGVEMMEGQERELLDQFVWGENVEEEGLEALVGSGDALFIPKGWWHSIKSVGTGITASVNWWFR
ncbi:Transcription factor jumonji aspartyl beta-hydroxylase protein [Rutstroemia sp. NJR-2017a BVV2]|nr:Transcription factor jumonji aspartyl beta-hydroxylase protein [Rutstroemia sp. NJR-2017a BVV2]